MSKKIILAIIIGVLVIAGIYQGFIKKEKPVFNLTEVVKGNVSQEVSETGQVKEGEEINLSFKNSGRIEKIYVKVGQEVEAGESLVKLETTDLFIQLQEAKAAQSVAQAKLDKLLAGSDPAEIQKAKNKVNNAREDSLNVLDDSYLTIYNAFNFIKSLQETYFLTNDQESLKVRDSEALIKSEMVKVESYIDLIKTNLTDENIDSALAETNKSLENISVFLKIIREICQEPNYSGTVSSTNKTSLDTHRDNINNAKSSVTTANSALITSRDELNLLLASPRQEDLDLYQAQVDQAKAQIQILENKIEDATLRSPVNGQITEIKKRMGELVQPALQDVVITLLPAVPFEIEVDVYEEDIVKINIGNSVDIALVAFPEKIFKGKVVAIDPAEKIIEGVVYYKTTITFEELPTGLRPGMTADLVIKTATKENVLIIPKDAIQKQDDKIMAEVFKLGTIEKKEIRTGLLGSDNMVEVISGLEEGEKVILR